MKTIPIKKLKRFALIFLLSIGMTSCMSTKVIGDYHGDDLDNEECQTLSHWKYWWGIGGSDEILVGSDSKDTVCPCEDDSISAVEVKSSFWDFLLTVVTVGIVNHRTVSYKCTEVDEGEQ